MQIEVINQVSYISKKYQTIFAHIPIKTDASNSLTSENLQTLYRILHDDGVLWICTNIDKKEDVLEAWPLDLSSQLQNSGFFVRNIIIWYNKEYESCSSIFINRYSYLLFVTKRAVGYKFYLDSVREPHIWKEFEWGGGRRNRYNPLGKNPSNFWIHTSSKLGKTIAHVPLTWEEMVTRCLRSSTMAGSNVLGLVPKGRDFLTVTKKLDLLADAVELGEEHILPARNERYKEKIITNRKYRNDELTPIIYYKSSEEMTEIVDKSIKLAVTSPPYWGLRDYGISSQIGFNESYERYLVRLQKVLQETYRVLREDGTLWININKRIIGGKMLLIPLDIIQRARAVGFKLIDILIWFRAISVPGTGKDNFTDRYEFILLFSKTSNYKIRSLELKPDFLCEETGADINVWKLYRRIGNISDEFKKETKLAIKHTAMFPEELVKRAILSGTNVGDSVLDPFLGSGTTVAIASRLGRKGIGYEINRAFEPLIRQKIYYLGNSLMRYVG